MNMTVLTKLLDVQSSSTSATVKSTVTKKTSIPYNLQGKKVSKHGAADLPEPLPGRK